MEKAYIIKVEDTGIVINSTGLNDIEKLGLLEFATLRLKQAMCKYLTADQVVGAPQKNCGETDIAE